MAGTLWGSDTAISMPEAARADQPILVDLDSGFGMTSGGIAHNLTEEQAELLSKPSFSPQGDQ
jgi:hypothetical protein